MECQPNLERVAESICAEKGLSLEGRAGGGGFIFMVARDAAAARKLRQRLETNPPNRLARFFDFQVDPKGLQVTVL
jgi:fucokinase